MSKPWNRIDNADDFERLLRAMSAKRAEVMRAALAAGGIEATITTTDDGRSVILKAGGLQRIINFSKTVVWRGPYVYGRTYEQGDAVTYRDAVWIADDLTLDEPRLGSAWTRFLEDAETRERATEMHRPS